MTKTAFERGNGAAVPHLTNNDVLSDRSKFLLMVRAPNGARSVQRGVLCFGTA